MAFTPFVETDQPTMANFNEKFLEAILEGKEQALSSGVKIETGSYVGTLTYGEGNPNSLTFGFSPKIVMITGHRGANGTTWTPWRSDVLDATVKPTEYVQNYGLFPVNVSGAYVTGYGKWEGNTLYWYNTASANNQNNGNGTIYYYLAIG